MFSSKNNFQIFPNDSLNFKNNYKEIFLDVSLRKDLKIKEIGEKGKILFNLDIQTQFFLMNLMKNFNFRI